MHHDRDSGLLSYICRHIQFNAALAPHISQDRASDWMVRALPKVSNNMDQPSRRPSSRRKACDRCILGKRRCDNQIPCVRCARRGLMCSKFTDLTPNSDTVYDLAEPNHLSLMESMPPAFVVSGLSTSGHQGFNWPTDVWRINELEPPIRVQLPPQYLNTMVRRLQSCAKMMVDEARTPFMRPLPDQDVYTNSAFDDALVACTAYLSRNKHNQASLNRTLTRTYTSLVHKLKVSSRPEEVLSATQGVVMLEIMLLLGDDEHLRGLAVSCTNVVTNAIAALNQWLIAELAYPSAHVTDMEGATSNSKVRYRRWLVLESVRRTVLTYWFLQGAYRHLRDGYCELVPLLSTLPLTVNGDLWAADDELTWCTLAQTEDLGTTVLPYVEATDWWMSMNYEHMDDFQIMLFESCRAIPARPFQLRT